jgi:hypothetical protein
MNSAIVTGTIVSELRFRVHRLAVSTSFDLSVDFGRGNTVLHIRATSALAHSARRLRLADHVVVIGSLHAESFDMPDRSECHRVEIVANQIDRVPSLATAVCSVEVET